MPKLAMDRASIARAIRGTRWLVERFERLKTKTVVVLHDEQNGYSIAYSLARGGSWSDFLKTIRAEARRGHEQVLADELEQQKQLMEAAPEG